MQDMYPVDILTEEIHIMNHQEIDNLRRCKNDQERLKGGIEWPMGITWVSRLLEDSSY